MSRIAILVCCDETTDGNVPIDNNCANYPIRPFVSSRKRWLLSATPDGASASSTP